MAALVIALALLLGGCNKPGAETEGSNIAYWHDDARGVGCWIWAGGGMSCLPDSEYTR